MGVSKVVLNNETLMDTTGKTVAADKMLALYTALDKAGNNVMGSIATKTSSDMTISGATVTAPAGFYESSSSKSVASGSEGTPTATKGTVSNHQVSVTPSVTNAAGYINGSTKTGTSVTVTASELASGNKAITSNGTGIDVVGYSTVSVAVPVSVGGVSQDANGYIVLDSTSPSSQPSGARTVASGTFTGPNTYYINVPVGTTVPTTNFAFYMWTTAEMAYEAKYKIPMLSYVLPSELGSITSTSGVTPAISININNSGTITSKPVVPPMGYTHVYNNTVDGSGYAIAYDRPCWKTLSGNYVFYWNRNNAQYTFPAVTYNWKLIYFGMDYENESMSL